MRKGFPPLSPFLISLCFAATTAQATELATQGYFGYSVVDTDAAFSCDTRACQGLFEDALFYGLSVGFQDEALGGQIIISQNAQEDPRISLAQLSYLGNLSSSTVTVRGGRIIVPLGLYGTHRISPNTRAGLVMPQSYVLNSFYDVLTLSDNGIALEWRGSNNLSLKAAAYQPSEETIETVVITPGFALPTNTGIVAGLVSLLVGSNPQAPSATPGTTQIKQQKREDNGFYVGAGFDQENWRIDGSATQLSFGDDKLTAYNVGLEYTWNAWQPSVELLRLETDKSKPMDGASVNLIYSAEHWQLFGNLVRFSSDQSDLSEDVVGGAYYWHDISFRLAHHRIRGADFVTSASGAIQDKVNSTVLSAAYSFNW